MLHVSQIAFGFSRLPLFRDVSFHVAPGQVLHLIGPNGVGKSTLMQVIAGVLRPQKGSVELRWAGTSLTDRRRGLVYLPSEGNGLLLQQDALANLRFWSQLAGRNYSDRDLLTAMGRWGLTNTFFLKGFPVGKFSTGMKRRLALARLTLNQSPLWLLDEPVYGLDPEAITRFRDQLNEHLQSGGAAVLISHDLTACEGLTPLNFRLTPSGPPSGRITP